MLTAGARCRKMYISYIFYTRAAIGIKGIAELPFTTALILIAVSVLLTLISGLIPARLAAKKDPVEALRSE